MIRAWLVLPIVAACARTVAPPRIEPGPLPVSPARIPRATVAAEVVTLRALADRACACTEEACFRDVDVDLAAYMEVATMNDPVTELETWPTDLDAMAHAATRRLRVCMSEGDFESQARGIYDRRNLTRLRDAACACEDAPCAVRVANLIAPLTQKMVSNGLSDARMSEVATLAQTARACVQPLLREQAILDLKAFRDAACDCTDAACAAEVGREMQLWVKQARVDASDQPTLDAMTELGAEIKACFEAARGP